MKIKNYYTADKVRNIENKLKKLLSVIPEGDISGLRSIVLVDEIYPKKKQILGRYRKEDKKESARIELAIKSILEEFPAIICKFTFIPDLFIGRVLYHEIGHHIQSSKDNKIKKNQWESFATKYSDEKLIKRFYWFLKPLAYIKKLIKLFKIINNNVKNK